MAEQFKDVLMALRKLSPSQIEELQATMDMMRAEAIRRQSIEKGQRLSNSHYGGHTHVGYHGFQVPRQQELYFASGKFLSAGTSSMRGKHIDRIEIDERCTEGAQDAKAVSQKASIIDTAGLQRNPLRPHVVWLPPKALTTSSAVNQTAPVVALTTSQDADFSVERVDRPLNATASRGPVREELAGGEMCSTPTPPFLAVHHPPILQGHGLTQRQIAVLARMLDGLPNKLIARDLGLTVNTVKEHVSGILRRLGTRTRSELMSRMNQFRGHEVQACDTSPVHPASDALGESIGAAQSCISITPDALGLTRRQGSVLLQLLDGLPNKEIAQRLGLTENTVKEHVSAILQRLGARTRMQLMSQMKNYCVCSSGSDFV